MREALQLGLLLTALVSSTAYAQSSWAMRLTASRARAELGHPDPAVRIRAAQALGRIGELRRSVAVLIDAFSVEEEDWRVRSAVLDALAHRGDEAAIPHLAKALEDAAGEERAAILRTIGAIGGESAIRVLIEWLGASDVGDDAVEGLVWIGAPAVPHLLAALRSSAQPEGAARALGAIGDVRATPALIRALREGSPPLRVAAAQALGALGDERAAPALAQALDTTEMLLLGEELHSLWRVAGPEFAPAVARLAERGELESQVRALVALVAMDPSLAAPGVERLLADGSVSAALRAQLVDAIVALPSVEMIGALSMLALEPAYGPAAAEALSRVPSGAGIGALLELPEPVRAFPLALAIRRHREQIEPELLERAQQSSVADASLRGAVLSALAGNGAVRPRLEAALSSAEPFERASAALGLALLGANEARGVVERAIVREDDPAVFRALALAADVLEIGVEPARLGRRLDDPSTAPEAFALAVRTIDRLGVRSRRRLRRLLRRGLREVDPRVRTGAAIALGEAGDREAWRALVERLDDEHDAVRLAAARALASLDVPAARSAIAARERVERDRDVRLSLRMALAPGSFPTVLRGRELLYVHVITAPGLREPTREMLEVDVLLPDGRWLRSFALSGGEVVLPGLPSGEAEVHARP